MNRPNTRDVEMEAVGEVLFCGSGSAENLRFPLPHRLFDLKSNLAKKFCAGAIVQC